MFHVRNLLWLVCLLALARAGAGEGGAPDPGFIAAHPVWRVAGDTDWRPFTFRGADGSLVGLDVEFSRVLADRTGARLEWVDVPSWNEALRRFRAGEIDLLMGTARSPEREQEMLFTRSYAASPVAVIMPLDSPFLITLQELNGKTVAAPDNHITTDYLRRHQPGIRLLVCPGVSASCQAVSDGRADAMVGGLIASASAIKAMGLDGLKVAGLVDMRFDLCVAVRKDWPAARDLLDAAIAVDPPEVRVERFDRWIGPVLGLQKQASRWRSWFRIALIATSGLLLGVLAVMTWNRVLSRRVGIASSALRAQVGARLESELRFRTIFEQAPIGMFRSTPDGRFLSVNTLLARMFGYGTPERMIAEVNRVGIPRALFENPAQREEIVRQVVDAPGSLFTNEVRYRTADGHRLDTFLSMCALEDPISHERTLIGFVQDITERKRNEASRHQREKLQALGQLAGGIAHDFNNMLCGIIGYADLLAASHGRDPAVAASARKIIAAATTASDLTGQLLRFARRGDDRPTAFDVHACIQAAMDLLRSTGFRGRITMSLDAAQSTVHGFPSVLQNAMLNLGINARDAMSADGGLTIATVVEELDRERLAGLAPYVLEPGRFLRISLADTGCGMSAEVLAACREPFFTTKGESGTGLGLTMVHGAVTEHHGALRLESAPGRGTTVHIYLPLAEGAAG